MASVSQIRTGIRGRLDTIGTLTTYATAPGNVTTPAGIVIPRAIAFDSTMARGSDDFTFLIQLLVSKGFSQDAQDQLDAYLAGSGSSSVKQAVDGDLDGLVHVAVVTEVGNYGLIEWNGVGYLGAELTCTVTASGVV